MSTPSTPMAVRVGGGASPRAPIRPQRADSALRVRPAALAPPGAPMRPAREAGAQPLREIRSAPGQPQF
ncbi:unnamed protein product [Caenorhabditis brenneri]